MSTDVPDAPYICMSEQYGTDYMYSYEYGRYADDLVKNNNLEDTDYDQW